MHAPRSVLFGLLCIFGAAGAAQDVDPKLLAAIMRIPAIDNHCHDYGRSVS